MLLFLLLTIDHHHHHHPQCVWGVNTRVQGTGMKHEAERGGGGQGPFVNILFPAFDLNCGFTYGEQLIITTVPVFVLVLTG